MPDFSEDFEIKLRGIPAITDLIGSGNDCRLYADVPKQGVQLPFLVYAEAGGDSIEHLSGGGSAGLCRAVVQVYAFAATRKAANELAEVVRRELKASIDTRWNSSYVTEISCGTHRWYGLDAPQDKQYVPRYWTRRPFDIWHSETV